METFEFTRAKIAQERRAKLKRAAVILVVAGLTGAATVAIFSNPLAGLAMACVMGYSASLLTKPTELC